MQSMQKSFGKLWSKGPGDNAKVSALLHDYEDIDKVLLKIIEAARLWRDSWVTLVSAQLQVVSEFESLYDPIVGATDGHGSVIAPTPEIMLQRTYNLKKAYDELKIELMEEIVMIEEKIIRPATDARDAINPIRKTIKKREGKRQEYEKALDKHTKLYRKTGRTPKEDAAMAKAQDELSKATEEFGLADEHLRQTLPPVIEASFNLVPPLVGTHVWIQNRLLGLYYTTLHGYCEEHEFPSPPPPMDDVIAAWGDSCKPIQAQAEAISCIARGKRGQAGPEPPLDGLERTASNLIPSTNGPRGRPLRAPSVSSARLSSPNGSDAHDSSTPPPRPGGRKPDFGAPTDFTTATALGGASVERASPNISRTRVGSVGSVGEYFNGRSSTTSLTSSVVSGSWTPTPLAAAAAAGSGDGWVKKKKPPPPPPKRVASIARPDEWVVALYTFRGEGQGDLAFNEGDRIKVVKKTGTNHDWWVGELNGKQGSFPANYCRAA